MNENILSFETLNRVIKIRANATNEKNLSSMICSAISAFHHLFKDMPLGVAINTSVLSEKINEHYCTTNLKTKFDVSLLYWMGKHSLCVKFYNNYYHHNRTYCFSAPAYVHLMIKSSLEIHSNFNC